MTDTSCDPHLHDPPPVTGRVLQGRFAAAFVPGRKDAPSASSLRLADEMETLLQRSDGDPLPPAVVARVRDMAGDDVSGVRVHVGPETSRLGAFAPAIGTHFYFSAGRYRPDAAGVLLVRDPVPDAQAERFAIRLVAQTLFASKFRPTAARPDAAIRSRRSE